MKKYNTVVWVMAMIALSLVYGNAQTISTNQWEPHGFVSVKAYDHYQSSRLGSSLTRTPVIWSEAEFLLPKGFYINSFGSYSISEAPDQKMGNQIDLVLGKRWKLSDLKELKLDFGVRYSNVAPLGEWINGDLVYINLVISRDFVLSPHHTIRPSIYSEWMSCIDAYDRGALIEKLGFTHIWKAPFGIKSLSFVSCNFFSYAGQFGKMQEGVFFWSDVSFNWRVTPKLELVLPGCRFIKDMDGTREDNKSLMAGARLTF